MNIESLEQLVRDKVTELGEGASAYFKTTDNAVKTWLKNGRIPLWAVEKVFAEIKDEFTKTPTTATEVASTTDSPPLPSHQEVVAAVGTHQAQIKSIVDHINNSIAQSIGALQKDVQDIKARFTTQPQVPTVAQILATDPDRNQPSLIRPVTQRNEAHPLDTGVAPSAEQVEASRARINAGGQIVGANVRPAGPATAVEGPQIGKTGAGGWTAPYPAKKN